jgi:hypothetical protein
MLIVLPATCNVASSESSLQISLFVRNVRALAAAALWSQHKSQPLRITRRRKVAKYMMCYILIPAPHCQAQGRGHHACKLLAANSRVVEVEGGGNGRYNAAELGEYTTEHVHGEINVPGKW